MVFLNKKRQVFGSQLCGDGDGEHTKSKHAKLFPASSGRKLPQRFLNPLFMLASSHRVIIKVVVVGCSFELLGEKAKEGPTFGRRPNQHWYLVLVRNLQLEKKKNLW